jgi:hypothetical protein
LRFFEKGNAMADERNRARMPVADDDGSFPFEVWKEGEFLKGYAKLDKEKAKADCDRGNLLSGNFEVRSKGKRVYP